MGGSNSPMGINSPLGWNSSKKRKSRFCNPQVIEEYSESSNIFNLTNTINKDLNNEVMSNTYSGTQEGGNLIQLHSTQKKSILKENTVHLNYKSKPPIPKIPAPKNTEIPVRI